MPLRVKCAGCGQVLEAPDSPAGKKAKCQNCGTVIELPPEAAFVPPQQFAGPPRQPVLPPLPKAPASFASSAPQGPLPQTHVAIDHRPASITVDHGNKAKSVFRTGFGMTLGCTAASALFFVGGCLLIAILSARATKDVDSTAEDTDSTVEESTPSPGDMSVGTQIPVDQGFEFKNVTTRRDLSIFKVLGEVTNNSGRSYSIANFVITVYDKGGKSLDSAHFNVSNLANGATKTFEVPVVGVWGDEIGRYKIEFKNGS